VPTALHIDSILITIFPLLWHTRHFELIGEMFKVTLASVQKAWIKLSNIILPPFHETCLRFVKIRMYVDGMCCLDSSKFR
jgi:hypothetical protein